MGPDKEYFAFISYKSEDAEWATWLQHELEHYHLPASFNGRTDVPKELRPVFRDIDELSAGNLPEQIKKALVNSQNLIVICSPQATESPWVNQEVETFISLGRTDRIFPFIVEGNSPSEFFPPALLNLPKKEERLGGDVSKKGRDAAFVKVVAGMLGVGFDSLWNRYEREKAEEERKIREQRDNLQRVQSRFIAEKANDLIEEGDSYTAKLLATRIIPTPSQPDFPYTIEAEMLLRKCANYENAILRGHRQNVTSAVYSHNSKFIASSSWDPNINIWNAQNGSLVKTIETNNSFHCLAYSPDDRLLAAGSSNDEIEIYDMLSYRVLKILLGHTSAVSALAFTHNGRFLASGSYDHTVRIWDVSLGTDICVITHNFTWIQALSFSSDDRYLIINDDNYQVAIWNLEQQNIEFTLEGFCSDISPNGKNIITGERTGVIKIWEFETMKEILSINACTGILNIVEFCSSGEFILSVSDDNIIRVWNAADGSLLHAFEGHQETISSASFCPKGRQIVSSSFDKTIRIWDMERGFLGSKAVYQGNSSINALSFISGSRNFASVDGDGNVIIWSLDDKALQNILCKRSCGISCVDISPQGNQIAFVDYDNNIEIWDIRHIEKLCEIKSEWIIHHYDIGVVPPPTGKHNGSILSIAFSKDGNHIITTSEDKTVKMWDVSTGQLIGNFIGHSDYVYSASFSPDNRQIISCSRDYTIRIWDVKTSQLQKKLTGHVRQVVTVVYTHDGKKIVSGSTDKTIKIWNVSDGRLERTLEGHAHTVLSVAVSLDNRWILSASADNTAKIWDLKSGLDIYTLRDHQDHINSAIFSPDGKSVITASSDGSIRIWDIPNLNDLISGAYERFNQRSLTQEERRKFYLC